MGGMPNEEEDSKPAATKCQKTGEESPAQGSASDAVAPKKQPYDVFISDDRVNILREASLLVGDREVTHVRDNSEEEKSSDQKALVVSSQALPRTTPDYTHISYGPARRIYLDAVLNNELNQLAFSRKSWEKYFGAVGKEPPLPPRIFDILNSPCPFWASRRVRDTHLLVLIPSKIKWQGRWYDFTLDTLGKLIKQKFPDNKDGYRYYSPHAKNAVGNEKLPGAPYWLLMTRDVLVNSRNTVYAAQKELVAGYANRTGLPYRLPRALEAATEILTHYVKNNGERLYSDDPLTYTRCLDADTDGDPILVGDCSSGGLLVDYDDRNFFFLLLPSNGVSCCRKF